MDRRPLKAVTTVSEPCLGRIVLEGIVNSAFGFRQILHH